VIIPVADYHDWLDALTDPDWRDFFGNDVTNNTIGHWYEAPITQELLQATAQYDLSTRESRVYIGFNPLTGATFKGKLRYAVYDPGCGAH
jgi:hypothetical protein